MYTTLRDTVIDFWSTFHGSGTIIWARAQVMLGVLYAGYTLIEPSSFDIPPHYVQMWVVGNGALAEYIRRRNAEYHDDGAIK